MRHGSAPNSAGSEVVGGDRYSTLFILQVHGERKTSGSIDKSGEASATGQKQEQVAVGMSGVQASTGEFQTHQSHVST
jgi:hypothetical protein